MFKKALVTLAALAAGSMVFANVDLRTNIRDIYYRGTCEEAGAITMSVNGDDFRTASTATPVFIRVRLDRGATLCNTLVSPNYTSGGATFNNVPIYLAMRLESSSASRQIAAPGETVSIVRWVEGETDIYLRVQSSSANWVADAAGTTTEPPTEQFSVAWSFGTTARTSKTTNWPLYAQALQKANLPANTRNAAIFAGGAGTETQSQDYAQSTLICIDVSEASFLRPFPENDSIVAFDTIAMTWDATTDGDGELDGDVRTAPTLDLILPFQNYPANFSGDDSIARGFDINCHISIGKVSQTDLAQPLQARSFVFRNLCFDSLLAVDPNQDVVAFTPTIYSGPGSMTFRTRDCFGWRNGSYVLLQTPAGVDYGFPVAMDSNGNAISAGPGLVALDSSYFAMGVNDFAGNSNPSVGISVIARAGSVSSLDSFDGNQNNSLVASEAWIFYSGAGFEGEPAVTITAQVCISPNSDPTAISFSGSVIATDRDTELDVAPFDGLGDVAFDVAQPNGGSVSYDITPQDQRKFCPPNRGILIGTFNWDFGGFTECEATAEIFYPYLPKVQGALFWSGISFVNQGFCDFDWVDAIHYEADGSRWVARFPALAVRNQQTWLLEDMDGTAVYTNDEGHADVSLTTAGSDLVALNMRSSMFLQAHSTGCVSGLDIDGFALIGNKVTNVVYGYLPRNTDLAAEGFEQDSMPPRNTKTGEVDLDRLYELVDFMNAASVEEVEVSPYRK